jgi:hypothetical protein
MYIIKMLENYPCQSVNQSGCSQFLHIGRTEQKGYTIQDIVVPSNNFVAARNQSRIYAYEQKLQYIACYMIRFIHNLA